MYLDTAEAKEPDTFRYHLDLAVDGGRAVVRFPDFGASEEIRFYSRPLAVQVAREFLGSLMLRLEKAGKPFPEPEWQGGTPVEIYMPSVRRCMDTQKDTAADGAASPA